MVTAIGLLIVVMLALVVAGAAMVGLSYLFLGLYLLVALAIRGKRF